MDRNLNSRRKMCSLFTKAFVLNTRLNKQQCCCKHPPEEQQEALVPQVGQSWFQLD